MKTLLLWIFAGLFILLTEAKDPKTFPENYVVVKMNKAATLACGTDLKEPVTWKFKGETLDNAYFDTSVDKLSQSLTVENVEPPMVGEYSCWKGEKEISSTYLLLERDESWKPDFLICRAKSYDCNFTCTWTHPGYTAVRLGLGHHCTKGEKPCLWVSSSEMKNGVFQFEISHYLPPYAEETTMLEVTAEAIVNLEFILRGTKKFYLRNIVQPDTPKIVKCQEVEDWLNVTIAPPPTWSTPHSFFSLEHEIEYVFRDDGRTDKSFSAVIPKRISKLRVRSRDSLVRSPWSQWTDWKNVKKNNKTSGDRCKKNKKEKERKRKGNRKRVH